MTVYTLSFKTGVASRWGHDNSVVLFADGEPAFGAEMGRIVRTKHGQTQFPTKTIVTALDHVGITLADVDRVVLPYDPSFEDDRVTHYTRRIADSDREPEAKSELLESTVDHYEEFRTGLVDAVASRLAELPGRIPPIETVSHHRAHAISAFYPSGFSEAHVLTIDFAGEYDSTVLWRGDRDGLQRLRTVRYPNSLGLFYAGVTEFLGYRSLNGEGKVMGLAAYGEPNQEIESRLRDRVTISADYDVTGLTGGMTSRSVVTELQRLLGREARDEPGSFSQWEKDLAYAAQAILEETVIEIVRDGLDQVETDNLALAGGVALNCKMNKRLMELPEVGELFVQPVANDAGVALGAAQSAFDPTEVSPMSTVYWGPEYGTDEIKSYLDDRKIPYRLPDDLAAWTADRLVDGDLVGWFQGRGEMGPRALGNRSILADPRMADSRDRVNQFVKHREDWRPFAPSILADEAEDYLVDARPAPYMIRTFDTPESSRDEISAVIHPGDGTTRPQTVTEAANPRYYRLIAEFDRRTDVPVVLNTSFNDSGEPIVNTPAQATSAFFSMGLDVLVMEDVAVTKADGLE